MAKFENLDTPKGLGELNKHLAERSYIEGYTPSAADVALFSQLKAAPDASKAPHVARWYEHVAYFPASERASWSGAAAAPTAQAAAKTEEDFDLFGEEDEDEHEKEIERRAQEQLAKSREKAAAKGIIQKSAVVIEVKPWEDTTDLVELEKQIRAIVIDGLEWKASKLVPIGYGIKKLVISCHVEDAKVSVDDIQEQIGAFEDSVQSTDIQSFAKL
jgi:elongation factor 1-beta